MIILLIEPTLQKFQFLAYMEQWLLGWIYFILWLNAKNRNLGQACRRFVSVFYPGVLGLSPSKDQYTFRNRKGMKLAIQEKLV